MVKGNQILTDTLRVNKITLLQIQYLVTIKCNAK